MENTSFLLSSSLTFVEGSVSIECFLAKKYKYYFRSQIALNRH